MGRVRVEPSRLPPTAKRCATGWRMPCPIHAPDRPDNDALSLSVEGKITCFAGCDWQVVRSALVESGVLVVEESRQTRSERDPDWWRPTLADSVSDPGAVAEYLAGRGLVEPPTLRLRWHPRRRAMVAAVVDATGESVGVHLTPIPRDRGERRTYGTSRGVIPLAAGTGTVLVGEGIETVLALRQIRQLAGPAYATPGATALGGAGQILAALEPSAAAALVAVDYDGAGLTAAERLGRDLKRRGWRVRLALPDGAGGRHYRRDWADWL